MTGSITIDGTSITAADFTADLRTLESDDDRRDGQLRQQALETGEFPEATFVLTQPIELGGVPADGETIEVTATGDLTLHGVTNSVQIPLQARLDGRRHRRGGLAPDRVRGLRDRLAAVDDGAVGRGQRRHGAPAPAHARLTRTGRAPGPQVSGACQRTVA